ncbi:MAG TPA: 3-hydroxyacyl-ACP dehydratase FabZ family protein [Xanthobacteraceae bacterium]|jgi:3-hydroxyacyl-[acyl-carrier-protein] dehydratase
MRLEYFQLIDRIVDLNLDSRTIRTQATVPVSSTIFEGHFPGFPLMPGVLLMESMAQTSGWLIIGITGFSRMPFLAAFSQAKLRAFVKPGDTLELTAALVHEGSGFARTKAEIRHDGKLACNAEITFRVVEFPNPEFRQHMQKAAAALAFPMEQLANG